MSAAMPTVAVWVPLAPRPERIAEQGVHMLSHGAVLSIAALETVEPYGTTQGEQVTATLGGAPFLTLPEIPRRRRSFVCLFLFPPTSLAWRSSHPMNPPCMSR